MDIKNYISSGIIELYVMGLCTTEEEKELEELRLQNPLLDDAILQYEMEMENKMQQNITLPPGDVDEKILNRLQTLNNKAASIDTTNFTPVKKINSVKPWWKIATAAALLLFIVSTYFNYSLFKKNKQLETIANNSGSETLPLSDYKVITNPAITPVAMYGVGSHAICRCTMFWDKQTGKAYIMIHHLPKSSSSKDYQLWAEVEGKMISVGIINDDTRGRFIEVANVPSGSIAFSITLEQQGGTNTPTIAETYLAGKI